MEEVSKQFVKDTTIIPTNKRTQDEVELVYVPLTGRELVGHYDVMIRAVRTRVQADKSNCLFHAYAYSPNIRLTQDQLRTEATKLRETVVSDITNDPGKFAEYIKLRVQMNNI